MSLIEQSLQKLDFEVEDKKSTYFNEFGHPVPRVTSILSRMIHSDALMSWANYIGMKGIKYREFMNQASIIGTNAHNAIEKYLQEKIKTEDNIPFLGFLEWYNLLTIDNGFPVEVIYIEHHIACKWFGGTLDCLARIAGKLYLIDFKTSNHIQYSYFLQLAAYRYMLRLEGIEVDGVIVLKLEKDEVGFTEYSLDFSNSNHLDFMNHCEQTFFSLVYGFYNINKTEEWFKKIFKKRGMEKNNGN